MPLEIIDLTTDEGRARADELDREADAVVSQGQQLYAKIKKSSKYFNQNSFAQAEPERWGWPFRVHIVAAPGDYCVQGGPGGQYRLDDVNLYIIEDGREMRIS